MRELKYPDDLNIVLNDIRENCQEHQIEQMKGAFIPNWKRGIFIAMLDESFGKEVGREGRVVWTWNDEWEIVDENRPDGSKGIVDIMINDLIDKGVICQKCWREECACESQD